MKLVTGARGLLGSEILRISNCIGISSADCNLLSPYPCDSFFYQIKKYTESSENSIDSVIHCAAKVGGLRANLENAASFFKDNMSINTNVIESCHRANIKLVSILSSCVYPDSPFVNYPLTEDQLHLGPPHYSNFGYAYAKRMLDVQSRAYRQQHGCNFITVIPNNLYGPNDNYDLDNGHVIPSLIRKFYEAKAQALPFVEVWGTGKPLREFTFARDAAEIILWLEENYDEETPVNIGNPAQISIEHLAILIGKEIGYEGDIIFDSNKPDGQFQKPTSNNYLRSLGWKKDYTPIEHGIKETIEFFMKNYPNLRGIKK